MKLKEDKKSDIKMDDIFYNNETHSMTWRTYEYLFTCYKNSQSIGCASFFKFCPICGEELMKDKTYNKFYTKKDIDILTKYDKMEYLP